jgi:hypothetical protein
MTPSMKTFYERRALDGDVHFSLCPWRPSMVLVQEGLWTRPVVNKFFYCTNHGITLWEICTCQK